MKTICRNAALMLAMILAFAAFAQSAHAQSSNLPKDVQEVVTILDSSTRYFNATNNDPSQVMKAIEELQKLKNYTDSSTTLDVNSQTALATSLYNLSKACGGISGVSVPDDLYQQLSDEIADDPVLGHIISAFYGSLGI